MKTHTRLFLAFLIIVSLGFYKLIDWVLDDVRPRYLESMEESMVDMATVLSSVLTIQMEGETIHTADLSAAMDDASRRQFEATIYEVTKTHLDTRVYVVGRDGIVIFDSDNGRDVGEDYSLWNDVIRTLRGEYGARATRTDPDDPRTLILNVASPITMDGEIVGALTVCRPAESVYMFIDATRRKILIAGVFTAAAVVLLGMVSSFWITRPIQTLIRYAHAVRDGERVPQPKLGRSEMGELAVSFEEMRDALEGKRYIEHYVQSLTHEMKSPLSAVRGAAELLQEDMPREEQQRFLRNIRTETNRIETLVDRLLQLAALESRKEPRDVEELDLGQIVKEVLESMRPLAASKGIKVISESQGSAAVRAERFLVRQAISNLVQNALDFAPRGGTVSVSLRETGQSVELAVSDSGPGIPTYAVERVFDRFYSLARPDTGKKGTGLGLTFVREAVLLHGGDATLENQPGGGARAALRLPRVLPEA